MLIQRLVTVTIAVLLAGGVISAPARADQEGINAKSTAAVLGVHSFIHQPSTTYNGSLARSYWVATTLPDGTFIQGGYADTNFNPNCGSGLANWFSMRMSNGAWVTSATPNSAGVWNFGSVCGVTGSHWYTIASTQNGSYWAWSVKVDGNAFQGGYALLSSHAGFTANNGGIITEPVAVGIPGSTPMPDVEYDPALGEKSLSGVWSDVAHATATVDIGCPPFKLSPSQPEMSRQPRALGRRVAGIRETHCGDGSSKANGARGRRGYPSDGRVLDQGGPVSIRSSADPA